MEAYVDISYIFHLLLCINSVHLTKLLVNIKINKYQLIIIEITSIILYVNLFLYTSISKYLNLMYFIIIFLLLFKKEFLKSLLAFLFSYYSSVSIIRLFTNNIFLYRYIIILNTPSSFFYILIAPMITLLIYLISKTFKSLLFLKKYKYNVSLIIKDKTYELSAYFDSGNTLKYNGIPVILISDTLKDKNESYNKLLIGGIGQYMGEYTKGKILFNNEYKDVYCAYVKKKNFNGCNCLLNVYLL